MDLGALLTGTSPLFTDVALLVGRVAIGVCFMIHAFGKLGWVGDGNLDGFASWLEDLGVPMPGVQAPHWVPPSSIPTERWSRSAAMADS